MHPSQPTTPRTPIRLARPATLTLCLLAGLPFTSAPCPAQDETPPPQDAAQAPERRPDARLDPLLTDISADEHMQDLLSRPVSGVPVKPSSLPVVQQVVPNLRANPERLPLADGSAAQADPTTLRPEGTFLVGWTGEVVRMRTGGLAFLPVAKTGAARPEPAMALLPCSTYSRLETLLGDSTRGLWLSLTGEVLVYQDRNWLLPTAFASADTPPTDQPIPSQPDQPEDTKSDPPPSGDRVEDLIRQLEAQRQERRGIDTTFAAPADETPAEGGPSPRLEGRMLLNQRGRMVRSISGDWVIAVDNDGGASNVGTLPNRLRLLPCSLVEVMERKAEDQGESWVFEISGHLYRHGETVYLLPRMFVSQPADDVKALQ
ncbi:MAG: hypothetical protein ACF8LK_08730 [Phycisphaerales bacterium JB041]